MQHQNSNFKAFKLLHKAMLIGQLLALAVFCYLIISKTQTPILKEKDRLFQVVTLLFTGAAFFIGNILFKKKINVLKESSETVQKKFEQYKSANLLQWALLEAATLFNGIAFFLVGNYAFIALAIVVSILFFMHGPNKTKMAIQLGLPLHEVENL
jgi:hypothetical protein